MADVHLRQEDLKALDQARQKLNQLAGNIGSLKNDMLQNNPLPEWESLQASAAILNRLIGDMSKHLAQHAELFQRIAVHPSTNFPGRTQEALLHNLLRKKLDIPVEDSVNEGRAIQAAIEEVKEKENDELWSWARDWVGECVAMHVINTQGQYYTAEEKERGIENVKTGLRRKFEDDESSEEDSDEDDDMEDVGLNNTTVTATKDGVQLSNEDTKMGPRNPGGQSRRLSDIMRYVTTGDPVRYYPTDRELDIVANKSMDFSPMQGLQKSRRS
ncbi:Mediator complex subunit 8 [Hyphodiscus hymeniophilus]|uniref:Mediator of RNA polymerase II transcription subunit 8 n=1 Tax=Hyphodiscus hymeniophilus TaxID=353542 RepID=A0A9P6SQR8_9HELO|nr:Mediator complex subunit 8 [Hyphodiscus hymeniophilus]